MARNSTTYDVFIAYDYPQSETAKVVADALRSHGLTVFYDTEQLAAETNFEDALWQAMAESHALVAILPEDISSSWLAFELGAAKAWNKPIYAVSAFSSHKNVPPSLRSIQVFPTTRVDEIAYSIASTSEPLTDDDVSHLGEAYQAEGVAVDELLLQPQRLEKLVKQFNKTSGRHMAGEQVMWNLLRLRKQSRLPVLTNRGSKPRKRI